MGQGGPNAVHAGAQVRAKNMKLPKHIKSQAGHSQQFQMSPIDAVNIIQKFRHELEREGNLMSEIERKIAVMNDAERAGPLPQFEVGESPNGQARATGAQNNAANTKAAGSWKTRFHSMSKTTVGQADPQVAVVNGQALAVAQAPPPRQRFREMLAKNRFSVGDRNGSH